MADKASRQQKRRIKNPESFREKASKGSSDKPGKPVIKHIKKTLALPFKWAGRNIKAFFGLRLFRPLHRPARIIGKIIFPTYFRNSFKELKLVTWPTWKQSRQLTYAVLVFAIVFGASIATVDWGLDKVFKNLLLK